METIFDEKEKNPADHKEESEYLLLDLSTHNNCRNGKPSSEVSENKTN